MSDARAGEVKLTPNRESGEIRMTFEVAFPGTPGTEQDRLFGIVARMLREIMPEPEELIAEMRRAMVEASTRF